MAAPWHSEIEKKIEAMVMEARVDALKNIYNCCKHRIRRAAFLLVTSIAGNHHAPVAATRCYQGIFQCYRDIFGAC